MLINNCIAVEEPTFCEDYKERQKRWTRKTQRLHKLGVVFLPPRRFKSPKRPEKDYLKLLAEEKENLYGERFEELLR